MISHLSGSILKKDHNQVILDVNGVGYEVNISAQTYEKLPHDGKASLFCHLIVREDAHILFGFFDELERALFKSIIKISGVGPKLAITILSNLPTNILIKTVKEKAIDNLISIPGIGKKSAERLMIELTNAIDKLLLEYNGILINQEIVDISMVSGKNNNKEAATALISLGFKAHEVNKVLGNMEVKDLSSEDVIKQALRLLSNK